MPHESHIDNYVDRLFLGRGREWYRVQGLLRYSVFVPARRRGETVSIQPGRKLHFRRRGRHMQRGGGFVRLSHEGRQLSCSNAVAARITWSAPAWQRPGRRLTVNAHKWKVASYIWNQSYDGSKGGGES